MAGADGLTYGLDATLKAQQEAKYDHELEREITQWIEHITEQKKEDQSFADWLKDGKVLCALVNAIKPGTIKKINTLKSPFKEMENITFFMNAARGLGVPESSMFGTPDLYEAKNLGSVLSAIYAFGGAVQVAVPEFQGPKLGVPLMTESKDHARDASARIATNQDQGFSAGMEIENKAAHGILRGSEVTALGHGTKAADEDTVKGLDADLKELQEAKYDEELEKEVVAWIEAVLGVKREGSVHEWLKSGHILCAVANAVKAGSVPKVNDSTMPFKQMENIAFFMNAAREMGVPEYAMFGTPDLYENKNMGSVLSCINVYGGAIQVKLPDFSPKLGTPLNTESADAKRGSGTITDMHDGFHATLEVNRKFDTGIHRS